MKHFYPLAWAVVDRETIRTCKWFIELLRSSLGLADGEGLTLMSDMQKVMKRLKKLEEEGKKWIEEYSPYSMDLYHDFRMIAQGCQVIANGDLGYEVAEGQTTARAGGPWFTTATPPQTQLRKSAKSLPTDKPTVRRLDHEFVVQVLSIQITLRLVRDLQFNKISGQVDVVPKRSKNSGKEKVVAPSIATADEDEVECGIESEDKDTLVAPRVISEAKTRLQMKKLQQQPIGSRKISFRGDENCVAIPTNLPYSPKKLTWKGKACVTSNQLTKDKEKKICKLKAKTGKH
ncbi:hypothetical protein MTR67_003751 [Solanum verrucosum]|uniref:Uncharacterized protein n=1 Tax=Solanum verrucosum TaxID=315347 RepID=A0AAF0PTA7_SOLVR|nr:hypothetical protein MTR67_003751 [Solanum verrucosum]